jgi:autotransporter-associated beta strand protein
VPTGQTVTDATTHTGSYQLVKHGGGTLVLDKANAHSGGTVVEAGTIIVKNASALGTGAVRIKSGATLVIDPAAGEAVAGSLVIEEGGFVDLGTGRMRITSGMNAESIIRLILVARGDGSWTATGGLGSSVVAAMGAQGVRRGIGWLANGDGSYSVAYAAFGDTNIDDLVDILDAANIVSGGRFNTGEAASWLEGDFNYDGMVDILDAADFLGSGLFNKGGYIAGESPLAVQMQLQSVAVADALTTPSATSAAFAAYASEGQTAPIKKKSVFAWFR